ncbi:Ilm1p ASCRUDRAFT_8489 [Ascoidea rubescens DSM 1968]|uniref:Uncharacterized protein n=1 Tax=Ascoidea rubescens DSM 1968 TaxID=1344418 RepID=A0A1D2VH03_9ASCO|nr:hypothetical protein ASCRUDRAFT_8489 [Ascoidea rubescens DSM 1968]ODV60916.1 hypothetical protein ASCRUDRAFT_8489 [Ascoidea rubescens DSM 1968]
MALFSSITLNYFRICFLLSIAYYIIKDPNALLLNNYVIIFGKSLELPIIDNLSSHSNDNLLGLFSVLFIVFALNDLIVIVSLLNVPIFKNLNSTTPTLVIDQDNNRIDPNDSSNLDRYEFNTSNKLYYIYFENLIPFRLLVLFFIIIYSYFSANYYFYNDLVILYCFLEIWINFMIYNSLKQEKELRVRNFGRDYIYEKELNENNFIKEDDQNQSESDSDSDNESNDLDGNTDGWDNKFEEPIRL